VDELQLTLAVCANVGILWREIWVLSFSSPLIKLFINSAFNKFEPLTIVSKFIAKVAQIIIRLAARMILLF
jgi:hypothetical protein